MKSCIGGDGQVTLEIPY